MPRKIKAKKPLIYVFYEGDSEKCYTQFLKEQFEDVVEIKYPQKAGLFEEASCKFRKEPRYKNSISETDEIWFFFDVEESDHRHCNERFDIIKHLRSLRKKPNIRVRLLMTTGCIEYWFMLHYQMMSPSITCKADKDRFMNLVKGKEPLYEKGNEKITKRIAKNYPTAIENGQKILKHLLQDGLPTLDDTDERNRWLHQCSKTFTTVQEAIQYLESL